MYVVIGCYHCFSFNCVSVSTDEHDAILGECDYYYLYTLYMLCFLIIRKITEEQEIN